MKTLKKDDINEKLLVDTLAYIETHPDDWNQSDWRCQTGMCFAGHAVLLGGSKPVAPVTRTLVKLFQRNNEGGGLTTEEYNQLNDWDRASYYLRYDPAVDGDDEEPDLVTYKGRNHKGVMISDRAEKLLGTTAVKGTNRRRYLFHGDNRLPKIRKHIADVLEITQDELAAKVRRVAKRNGWQFPDDAGK